MIRPINITTLLAEIPKLRTSEFLTTNSFAKTRRRNFGSPLRLIVSGFGPAESADRGLKVGRIIPNPPFLDADVIFGIARQRRIKDNPPYLQWPWKRTCEISLR